MSKKLALFDMDYTIIAYDTLIPFAGFVVRRAPYRILYLAVFFPACLLYAMGVIGRGGLKRAFLSVLWRMKGEDVEKTARAFVDTIAVDVLYADVLLELKTCKAQGMHTILNTASPEFYVRFIAEKTGFDELIGTQVRIDPVMPLLPVIEGKNNRGIEKILRMRESAPKSVIEAVYANYQQLERDPGAFETTPFAEIAYTDSKADLPLLACAKNGVLVNPSEKLASRAESAGWKILRPARPYGSTVEKYVRLCLCLVGLLKLK